MLTLCGIVIVVVGVGAAIAGLLNDDVPLDMPLCLR